MRSGILNLKGDTSSAVQLGWGQNNDAFQISAEFLNEGKFIFSGFKNIDIYSIQIVGGIYTPIYPIVGNFTSWNLEISLDGQSPLISGQTDPLINNPKLTQPSQPTLLFTNNVLKLELCNPVKSVNFLQVNKLIANGIHYRQQAGPFLYVELEYDFTIILNYKFEGE